MDSLRTCTKCKVTKDITAFGKQMKNGRFIPRSICKECQSGDFKEWKKKRYEENPNYGSDSRKIYRYGITPDQFNQMLAEQGNRCAICLDEFTPEDPPKMDHDHKTGAARGILCQSCNVLIGKVGEDPEVLRARGYNEAAWYLERRSNEV